MVQSQRSYSGTHRQTLRPPHSRRLWVEALEDRRLLAAVTVTNDLDLVNGDTSSIANLIASDGGDGIALREAIQATNNDAGDNTIDFDAALDGQTILLTQGELAIAAALTIDASNLTGDLTIDASGNDPTPDENNGDGSRIFNIDDGDSIPNIDIELRGLTLTGGDVSGDGGAILSEENLSVTGITISNNTADRSGGGGIWAARNSTTSITASTISGNSAFRSGGGIFSRGDMTVTSSTISGNSSDFQGGGIDCWGTATVTSSTISDNSADNYGGGITAYTVTVTSSTISGNMAGSDGGGFWGPDVTVISSTISGNSAHGYEGGGIWAKESITIIDSTISGNSAPYFGGGIQAREGTATITGSTIYGNLVGDHGFYAGGGIAAEALLLDHTIVAGNLRGTTTRDDIGSSSSGSIAATFSLIGDDTGATITDNGGNLIGTSGAPIDPLLGPLVDNGGPTQTHALLPGSPAIDAGNPTIQQVMDEYDQRGHPFLRVADGDLLTVIVIDMGAYEAQAPPSADCDSDHDVDGIDFLAWQRGYGTTVGATRPDGNSDDDEDVDASDLAAWDVSFGDSLAPLASAQSTASDQLLTSLSQQATIPTLNIRAELIDAAIALATTGHQALLKEGAVVVEDGLNLEALYEGMFVRHDPLPPASASSLSTWLSSEGEEGEEGELEEVVDRALESVFG